MQPHREGNDMQVAVMPLSLGGLARWGGATTVLVCAVCIAWVDLPAARWLHQQAWDTHDWMLRLLGVPVVVSILLGVYLLVHLIGSPRTEQSLRARRLYLLGLGMMVALAAKTMLKIAFGRTWPRLVSDPIPGQLPSECSAATCGYVNDSVHAFVPFAGSLKAYSAFPSGSTALLLAVVVPCMVWLPRLRWYLAYFAIFSLACYVATNTHFISDVVAGAYVGLLCGTGVVVADRGSVRV